MLLAIDSGNTNVVFAVYDDDALQGVWRCANDPNRTADEWRIGMFSGYILGWLRQEQNFYLTAPPKIARKMPEKLARLLGYSLHKPFLGWVEDFQDPWDVLQGYEELSSGGGDLYASGAADPVQGANVRAV